MVKRTPVRIMGDKDRHISPAIREMLSLVDKQRELHQIGITMPTNIDGDPWSPEEQYRYSVGELIPDYGTISCRCGWVSAPFIFINGNEDEMIHEDHVNEELRKNVYRA